MLKDRVLITVQPKFFTFGGEHNPIIDKIQSFRTLRRGWHFGEGLEIPEENIHIASILATFLQNNSIINLDVFPGFNGEIQITAYSDRGYFFEVTINEPQSINIILEDPQDIEVFSQYSADYETVRSLILSHKNLFFPTQNIFSSWSMRGSSVYTTMTKLSDASPVLHSNLPQTGVYRLYNALAE